MSLNINHKKIKIFAVEQGIKFIILFGSQAKKHVTENSDFDIAILTANGKGLEKLEGYTNILFNLSEILSIPDYKIDLTNLDKADPLLRHEIVLNGLLIYGDETEYASFKTFVLREFIETENLRLLEKKLIFKRQKLLEKIIYA